MSGVIETPADGGLTPGQRFARVEREVDDLKRWAHEGPNSVDQWRAELRGAFGLVKLALGTSLVSAVLGIAAIIKLVTDAQAAVK